MALIEQETLKKYAIYLHGFGAHKYVPLKVIEQAHTIDPIRAAGGCRCGECRHHGAADGPMRQCDITDDNDFCSYGEPREAQDDG